MRAHTALHIHTARARTSQPSTAPRCTRRLRTCRHAAADRGRGRPAAAHVGSERKGVGHSAGRRAGMSAGERAGQGGSSRQKHGPMQQPGCACVERGQGREEGGKRAERAAILTHAPAFVSAQPILSQLQPHSVCAFALSQTGRVGIVSEHAFQKVRVDRPLRVFALV
eukprot:6191137-Pleurochrysis_carterae.AAC.1